VPALDPFLEEVSDGKSGRGGRPLDTSIPAGVPCSRSGGRAGCSLARPSGLGGDDRGRRPEDASRRDGCGGPGPAGAAWLGPRRRGQPIVYLRSGQHGSRPCFHRRVCAAARDGLFGPVADDPRMRRRSTGRSDKPAETRVGRLNLPDSQPQTRQAPARGMAARGAGFTRRWRVAGGTPEATAIRGA
jgi:hypothetical protein